MEYKELHAHSLKIKHNREKYNANLIKLQNKHTPANKRLKKQEILSRWVYSIQSQCKQTWDLIKIHDKSYIVKFNNVIIIIDNQKSFYYNNYY